MDFNIPSNLSHSTILWFYDSIKYVSASCAALPVSCWGCPRRWRGTEPGQPTQTNLRDSPYHTASCWAVTLGELARWAAAWELNGHQPARNCITWFLLLFFFFPSFVSFLINCPYVNSWVLVLCQFSFSSCWGCSDWMALWGCDACQVKP